METLDSPDLRSFLMENAVPTVIGPGPDGANFYITDHHHFATALFQAFLSFKRPTVHRLLYACIQADYSQLDVDHFWIKMEEEKLVFLEDEKGNNISVQQLPDDLKLMADNPYRTLASWLRSSHAFIKCGMKKTNKLPQCKDKVAPFFIECYWADFMREKFPLNDYPIVPDPEPPIRDFIYRAALQLQTEALKSIFKEAVKYAMEPVAKNMPGYNESPNLLAPEPIQLDASGCPM